MNKLYQVFISSTYRDLVEEREKVITTLQQMGHIPAGMELFKASADDKIKYIKKVIDYSDYYVLIIGSEYGSLDPRTNKSYTQIEYEYAKSKNIPILAFYKENVENADENFINFREEVKNNHLCKPWKDRDDLTLSIITSLTDAIAEYEMPGWIRGGKDVSELHAEAEKLRSDLVKCMKNNSILSSHIPKIKDASQGEDLYEIIIEFESGEEYGRKVSWRDIFEIIFGQMHGTRDAITLSAATNRLKYNLQQHYEPRIRFINEKSMNTIITQFGILKYIIVTPSTGNTWINLTEVGELYRQSLIVVKRQ